MQRGRSVIELSLLSEEFGQRRILLDRCDPFFEVGTAFLSEEEQVSL